MDRLHAIEEFPTWQERQKAYKTIESEIKVPERREVVDEEGIEQSGSGQELVEQGADEEEGEAASKERESSIDTEAGYGDDSETETAGDVDVGEGADTSMAG